MNSFNLVFNFLTFSATLNVKSGLSTLNKTSGLNLIISSTVLFILFLILKIFNKTLVKANISNFFKFKNRFYSLMNLNVFHRHKNIQY